MLGAQVKSCRASVVDALEKLYNAHKDNEHIANVYAAGLVGQSSEQDLSGSQNTVQRIADLYDEFKGNADIALQYAKGLVNLTVEQDLSGSQNTIQRIADLYG